MDILFNIGIIDNETSDKTADDTARRWEFKQIMRLNEV